MAETLAEKLKRLAREKAEAKAKAESSTVAEVTEVANVQPVGSNEEKVDAPESGNERSSCTVGSTGQGNTETLHESVSLETELVPATDPVGNQSLPVAAASNYSLNSDFFII